VVGSPSYMAPEQASGEGRAIGPTTDIYGLGAVLYEMLTGHPPFREATVMATLMKVGDSEPMPPHASAPSVGVDLETICLKCLHKEPEKRYASAGELADDLGRFLAGEPILARPAGPLEKAYKWARRSPTLAAVVVALVLVIVSSIAGLWALYR